MKKLLLALLFSVLPISANATLLNFSLETTLDTTNLGGSGDETVKFNMLIDSNTPENPHYADDPQIGIYEGLLTISIGAQSATGSGSAHVYNNLDGVDSFALVGGNYAPSNGLLFGLPVLFAFFVVEDFTQLMFSDDSLPTPEELSGFDTSNFAGIALGTFNPPGPIDDHGVTVTITIGSVPEPSSLVLFLLGLSVFWRVCRGRA